MKKRKNLPNSPTKVGHHTLIHIAPTMTKKPEEEVPRVRINLEKQPPGRDGHSSFLYKDKWIIFGGDRHHMPFNDTYVLDLQKIFFDD
jgi:hypothetical protein